MREPEQTCPLARERPKDTPRFRQLLDAAHEGDENVPGDPSREFNFHFGEDQP